MFAEQGNGAGVDGILGPAKHEARTKLKNRF